MLLLSLLVAVRCLLCDDVACSLVFAVVRCLLFVVCSCWCSLFLFAVWLLLLSYGIVCSCPCLLSVVLLHRLRLTACGMLLLVTCRCLLLSVGVDVCVLCWCCAWYCLIVSVLGDVVCLFVVCWR